MSEKFVRVNAGMLEEFLGWVNPEFVGKPMFELRKEVRIYQSRQPGMLEFRALSKDRTLASSIVRIGSASAIVFEMETKGPIFDAYEQETSSIVLAHPKIQGIGAN